MGDASGVRWPAWRPWPPCRWCRSQCVCGPWQFCLRQRECSVLDHCTAPPLCPVQGDEPLIEPECIDAVVQALQDSPDAVYRWA